MLPHFPEGVLVVVIFPVTVPVRLSAIVEEGLVTPL